MSIIRLDKLLKSGSASNLNKIIRCAQNMGEFTDTLRAALPADLASNLISAALRDDGELVLVCSSSAWASRLRFECDALIDAAKKAGRDVKSCRVSVAHKSY